MSHTLGLATSRMTLGLGFLVLAQAVHSIEECVGRMWESHPLARFVAGLVATDLAQGFIIANVLLVACGAWSVLWPVRRGWRVATALAWFWVGLETVNAIAHSLWSLFSRQYTPGLATAPLLILTAGYLGYQLHVHPIRS
jgi:hypothetical protein